MTAFLSKRAGKPLGTHRGRIGLRIPLLAFCGLVLIFGVGRGLRAAVAGPVVRSSPAQNAANGEPAGKSQLQIRRRAERREEIHRKGSDNPEAEDEANVYRHSAMVNSLAHVLGLSTEQASRLFETFNFILLLIGIIWIVARILPKTLRGRSERIQTEIQQARAATEDANRRLANVEERLARLDGEIDAIRTQAEQETAIEEKRLRAALEQEKQMILDAAAQDITAATNNAENLLKNLAAELVIEHAKRRIAVTPETDRSLIDTFLTDLDANHGGQPRGGVN